MMNHFISNLFLAVSLPTGLDYELYFNIAFFSILGMGVLFGFLKGFRKAIWSFTVTVVFIVFFFYTIDLAVQFLWNLNLPFLGGVLINLDPVFSSVTSLGEALPLAIEHYFEDYAALAANANVLELLTSISLFVVKIIYAILYFTVIQVLYRLILWIVKSLFVPSKKKSDKYKDKNRGLGALVGLLQGGVSLYVTLILFGGLMSFSGSMTNLIPEEGVTANPTSYVIHDFRPATSPVLNMETSTGPLLDVDGIDEAVDVLNEMITAYNNNYIVTYSDMLTINSPYDETEQISLNLYLFDQVLSMNYKEKQIAFRAEFDILSEMAGEFISSDFSSTGNLNDLSSEEVRSVFGTMATSNLFKTIIPVAVEGLSEVNDLPLELPIDELYALDWGTEIAQLGEVAAVGLDIVNAAGILGDNVDLATVTLDGDDVGDLFDELSQSSLASLGAYVALQPLLDVPDDYDEAVDGPYMGGFFLALPVDLDWASEFSAIGAIATSVLNAGLTVGSVSEEGDVGEILTVLADIDFTILTNSQIVSNAMINILTGVTSVELPEFITVPDTIEWYNSTNGSSVVYGELHNILAAVNALSNSAAGIDFSNMDDLGITTISNFTSADVNALFESKILVASITNVVKDIDLGDSFEMVIPDISYDSEGYLLKTELQSIVNATLMMVDELACDVGDTTCEEIGVDITKILTLDSNDLDILFGSDILYASVSNLIITETAADPEAGTAAMLTIPGSVLTTLAVDGEDRELISKAEVKNMFNAVTALGISSIDDVEINESILQNLAEENDPTALDEGKADDLFGSLILNATISQFIFDFTDDEASLVVVPYRDELDLEDIRALDTDGVTEYITDDELTNLVKAILKLDIGDFSEMDQLDIGVIMTNMSTILESSIMHATISNQLLGMDTIVRVPSHNASNEAIKVTVGTGDQETTYITSDELNATFNALTVLDITDVEGLSMDLTILNRLGTELDPTILDTNKSNQLWESAIITATISKFIVDSDTNGLIEVPYVNELNNPVRIISAHDSTEYIEGTELNNLLKAVLSLNLTNFNNIDTLSLTTILNNRVTLLDSCIIQATVSKQIIDLPGGVIQIPEVQEDNVTEVLVTRGDPGEEYTYIKRSELDYLLDSLQVLNISDINGFDGEVDLSLLQAPNAVDTIAQSTILQATISKQVIDMENNLSTSTVVVVPYMNPADDELLRKTVGVNNPKELIVRDEVKALLNGFVALEFEDINSVQAAIDVENLAAHSATIFNSYIIQATVSDLVIDLELTNPSIEVPYWSDNSLSPDQLRFTSGPVGKTSEYIEKQELINLMAALDEIVSSQESITDFSGSVTLSDFYEVGPRTTLLNSYILQASISKQLIDLGDSKLVVPYFKMNETTAIRVTTGAGIEESNYITDNELHNIFEALELFNVLDVNNFNAANLTFGIFMPSHGVGYETNQNTLLNSACIQATISKQVKDIGGDIVVPSQDIDSTLVYKQIATGSHYITTLEIKRLFNALDALNLNSVNSFGGTVALNLLNNSSSRDTVVTSAIMHATLSTKMLGTSLIVPDTDINRAVATRVTVLTQEYIEKIELKALLTSLTSMSMTNYGSMNVSLATVLSQDMNVILASATMQATVSDNFLDTAKTYAIASSGEFVVPNAKREAITVDAVASKWIELVELKAILASLDTLGIYSFNISVNGSVLNGKTPAQVDTILTSASLHLTVEKMIKANTNISIPDIDGEVVIADSLYGLTDIITRTETVNFVVAMNTFGGSLTGSFDLNNLATLSDAEKTLVISSAIARLELTPSLELILAANVIVPSYEVLATPGDNCLTLASAQTALDNQ